MKGTSRVFMQSALYWMIHSLLLVVVMIKQLKFGI